MFFEAMDIWVSQFVTMEFGEPFKDRDHNDA